MPKASVFVARASRPRVHFSRARRPRYNLLPFHDLRFRDRLRLHKALRFRIQSAIRPMRNSEGYSAILAQNFFDQPNFNFMRSRAEHEYARPEKFPVRTEPELCRP